jgi:hypothetical protein
MSIPKFPRCLANNWFLKKPLDKFTTDNRFNIALLLYPKFRMATAAGWTTFLSKGFGKA